MYWNRYAPTNVAGLVDGDIMTDARLVLLYGATLSREWWVNYGNNGDDPDVTGALLTTGFGIVLPSAFPLAPNAQWVKHSAKKLLLTVPMAPVSSRLWRCRLTRKS